MTFLHGLKVMRSIVFTDGAAHAIRIVEEAIRQRFSVNSTDELIFRNRTFKGNLISDIEDFIKLQMTVNRISVETMGDGEVRYFLKDCSDMLDMIGKIFHEYYWLKTHTRSQYLMVCINSLAETTKEFKMNLINNNLNGGM